MGTRVLFIYPNTYGMNMLPPAIAMFSAILKKEGHQVQIFDTTYYSLDYGIDSDGSKMERAEKNDTEGNRIYTNLKAEYLEKYMPKPDADPHSISAGPENITNIESPYLGAFNNDVKKNFTDEMN